MPIRIRTDAVGEGWFGSSFIGSSFKVIKLCTDPHQVVGAHPPTRGGIDAQHQRTSWHHQTIGHATDRARSGLHLGGELRDRKLVLFEVAVQIDIYDLRISQE